MGLPTPERLRGEGLRGLLSRSARYARSSLETLAATPALRRQAGGLRTVEEALDFAQRFKLGSVTIAPLQLRAEIEALLSVLETERPSTLIEIGTFLGGSLFLFSRVAADDATLISIDLHRGEWGGGYPAVRSVLYRSFARKGQRIELVRADSHDPRTLQRTKRLLDGRDVDFLFIDGDHSYDGVRSDLEMYGPLVRPGGLIAFHDIMPTDDERVGVPALWSELKDVHDTRELRSAEGQRGKGIGLVRLSRALALAVPATAAVEGKSLRATQTCSGGDRRSPDKRRGK